MKASRDVTTKPLSAEQQIKGFIAKFEPKHQALIRSVRKTLRKRFPSANELVYDYSKSFVIGYSPIERGIDSVVAISLGADGLRLYFNQGPQLPDPTKILLGSGKQTRFIQIESPRSLLLPEVEALLEAAIDRAKTPFPLSGRGKLIMKSKPAKQRPGRKRKR
jgi:hypothetical protein